MEYLKNQQVEFKTPDMDIVQWVWQAIMDEVDWTSKPDQIEGLAMKTINVSDVSCFTDCVGFCQRYQRRKS